MPRVIAAPARELNAVKDKKRQTINGCRGRKGSLVACLQALLASERDQTRAAIRKRAWLQVTS